MASPRPWQREGTAALEGKRSGKEEGAGHVNWSALPILKTCGMELGSQVQLAGVGQQSYGSLYRPQNPLAAADLLPRNCQLQEHAWALGQASFLSGVPGLKLG